MIITLVGYVYVYRLSMWENLSVNISNFRIWQNCMEHEIRFRSNCWRFCFVFPFLEWQCQRHSSRMSCGGRCRLLAQRMGVCLCVRCSTGPSDANGLLNLFKFALWKMHSPYTKLFNFRQKHWSCMCANSLENLISFFFAIYFVIYSAIYTGKICFFTLMRMEKRRKIGSPDRVAIRILFSLTDGCLFDSLVQRIDQYRGRAKHQPIFLRQDDCVDCDAMLMLIECLSSQAYFFQWGFHAKTSTNWRCPLALCAFRKFFDDDCAVAAFVLKSCKISLNFFDFFFSKSFLVEQTFDKYLILFSHDSCCAFRIDIELWNICGCRLLVASCDEYQYAENGSSFGVSCGGSVKRSTASRIEIKDDASKWISVESVCLSKGHYSAITGMGLHWNAHSESKQTISATKKRQRQTDAMKYYIFCMRNRKSNKIIFSISPSIRHVAFSFCRFVESSLIRFRHILLLCRDVSRYIVRTPCGGHVARYWASSYISTVSLFVRLCLAILSANAAMRVCVCAFLFNFSCDHRSSRRDFFFRFVFFSTSEKFIYTFWW